MKQIKIIALTFILVTLFAMAAQAKWWIFGQSQDEISIRYLYLNKMSFDETTKKITIYKDTLEDNLIHIRGKATVRKGTIAEVRITLDEKETWQKASLSDDGAFSFSYTPEGDKDHVLYIEITDTRGKTNDVDATRKEIVFSSDNILGVIRTALDAMVEAYRNEDPIGFMAYVSENFAGDDTVLDRAVRQDFSAFDNIDLRYTLGTIATDAKGMIFVSLNFNRLLVSTRSGRSYTDRGTTEFVFQLGTRHPVVYSMKNPLIFGLSDAGEVSTGTVIAANNDPIIVVDDRGNVTTKPFDEAIDFINGDADIDENVEFGNNIIINSESHPPAGFDFSDGSMIVGGGDFVITGGDDAQGYAYGFLSTGVLIRDLGMVSLNDVSEAPGTGYADHTNGLAAGTIKLYEGHAYAFQLPGPKYALIYVRSVTSYSGPCPFNPGQQCNFIRMRMDYKYRADGQRDF